MLTDADETLTCGCARRGMFWTKCDQHKDWVVATPSMGFTPIADIRTCGCWIVNLAQGKAILTCVQHEAEVLKVIE